MCSTPTRRRRPVSHRPAPLTQPGVWAALVFVSLLAAQAQAQPSVPPRPDPLDAKAQVPSTRHESSLASFRRSGEDQPIPWREANDTVTRIGGWKAYAREAQQPDPTAAKPATPARPPASAPGAPSAPVPPGRSGHLH
jgi:hypothetical protein